MTTHQRVRAWITQNYQKPAIDQEWLTDCSDWVASELGLDPTSNFDQFIQHVEAQLLQSNLADSTVPGSGIDPFLVASNPGSPRRRSSSIQRPARQKETTGATPLLVEIKSITEIAHSAFNLLNIHQTRFDRADLGLAQDEDTEQHRDEDEGPIPKFPRGMLRLELSDGSTTFRAIEFRSLPQLELGTTPLGYKMFLKSTPIRNGIAFLEPSNVILKGYRTEDHDINSEQVFLSSLRKRLGRPDPPPDAAVAAQSRVNPVPAQPAHQHQPPPVAQPPLSPADIDDMYVDVDPDVLREMAIQMDEVIDMQENQRVGNHAPPSARPLSASKAKSADGSNSKQALRINTTIASSLIASSTSLAGTSSYFTAHSSESKPIPDIGLSPRPIPVSDPESSKSRVKEAGSMSRKPATTAPTKRVPSGNQPSSPNPYDDLSFDMDMDDSFLEQVGMIEQGALGTPSSKGRYKGKDTRKEGHSSVALASKTPSGSILGAKHLATFPVSSSRAEPQTRMPASTKRATSASSLSGSNESLMPQSTQSSDCRLPRDPSLIVISSSEDEAQGCHGSVRPLNLAQRRANKENKTDEDEVADSDVIDISD